MIQITLTKIDDQDFYRVSSYKNTDTEVNEEYVFYYWTSNTDAIEKFKNRIKVILKAEDFNSTKDFFEEGIKYQPQLVLNVSEHHVRSHFVKEIFSKIQTVPNTERNLNLLKHSQVAVITDIVNNELVVEVKPKEHLQQYLKNYNKSKYNQCLSKSKLFIDEINADVDFGTQYIQNIDNLINIYKDSPTLKFRIFDNTEIEISYDSLQIIKDKMLEHSKKLYDKKWEYNSIIDDVTNFDSYVAAYDMIKYE